MPVYQNIANCDVCKKAFAAVETGPVYKNLKPIWHLFCSIFAATLFVASTLEFTLIISKLY